MGLVEQREAKTLALVPVALGIDGEDEGEGCSRLAERVDSPEDLDRWPGDSGQQAAPGEDDRDAISDAGQLGRQALDGSPHEDEVGEAVAVGPTREVTEPCLVRVDADEEAIGPLPGEGIRQSAVARPEVDRDAAPEGGELVSESVIGAFETLASYDIHGQPSRVSIARGSPLGLWWVGQLAARTGSGDSGLGGAWWL